MFQDMNIIHFPPKSGNEAELSALREELALLREELDALSAGGAPEAAET